MSKISLKPNDSGSANFTIESPATNTNRTFTLPDEQGTVLTDVSDIEPQVKTSLNATGSAPIYACRAWVNFKGTGTVSIRESGNVSSITDDGAGDFRVNFSISMPDTNYSIVISSGGSNSAGYSVTGSASVSTSYANLQTAQGSGGAQSDREFNSVAVFR